MAGGYPARLLRVVCYLSVRTNATIVWLASGNSCLFHECLRAPAWLKVWGGRRFSSLDINPYLVGTRGGGL